ncbi:hypothetical protein KXV85_005533, partial [Aspergillus fumigatus]
GELSFRIVNAGLPRQMKMGAQGGQRRAHLMRGIGREFPDPARRAVQAQKQIVERLDQPAQFPWRLRRIKPRENLGVGLARIHRQSQPGQRLQSPIHGRADQQGGKSHQRNFQHDQTDQHLPLEQAALVKRFGHLDHHRQMIVGQISCLCGHPDPLSKILVIAIGGL